MKPIQPLIQWLLLPACVAMFENCDKGASPSDRIQAAIYSGCNVAGEINFHGEGVFAGKEVFAGTDVLEVGGYSPHAISGRDELGFQFPWPPSEGTYDLSARTDINYYYDPNDDGLDEYGSLNSGTITISNLNIDNNDVVKSITITFDDVLVMGTFSGGDTLCMDRGEIGAP